MTPGQITIGLLALLVVILIRIENKNREEDLEWRRKKWKEGQDDYNKVATLIEQGYSDDEIYAKLGYKMLPFLVSDVRKTMVK